MRRSLTLYLAAMAVILLLGIFEALAHWWVLLVVAGMAVAYGLGRRHGRGKSLAILYTYKNCRRHGRSAPASDRAGHSAGPLRPR